MERKNVERIYSVKWQKDLELFLPIYNCFVLEGAINDLFAHHISGNNIVIAGNSYPNMANYEYLGLSDYIAEEYTRDYVVVVYDNSQSPSDRFSVYRSGAVSPHQESVACLERLLRDASSNNGNDQSQEMRYLRDVIRRYDAERKKHNANSAENTEKLKPLIFILKGVSRFSINLGHLSPTEFEVFKLLFEISQLRENDNKVILLVDKMNDLPAWWESENTNQKIKKLFLTRPDSEFKKAYFLNELADLFTPDYSILRINYRALTSGSPELLSQWDEKRKKFDDDMNRFSAYTDNFAVQTLELFKRYLQCKAAKGDKDITIKNLSALSREFLLGCQENPWDRASLRRIVAGTDETSLIAALQKAIKGQNHAIASVQSTLKNVVTGLSRIKDNDRRPRAVFFLAGPTGTGKTELVKTLASKLFGSEERMIRFDMSEFSSSHTDARLFGAPPGYVGYEAGGELTKAIKQNPFSIILFDEIEKAAGNILDKFLQILGDGRLTDGKGETVYFSDSIIVFTSNCGITALSEMNDALAMERETVMQLVEKCQTEYIESQGEEKKVKLATLIEAKAALALYNGIRAEEMDDPIFTSDGVFDENLFSEYVQKAVKGGVKRYFEKKLGRPELLGRIGEDNIIVYNFMMPSTARMVVETTIKNFCTFMENNHRTELIVTKEAENAVFNLVATPAEKLNMGARGIVMSTEEILKNLLSNYLCDETAGDGDDDNGMKKLMLCYEEDRLVCKA